MVEQTSNRVANGAGGKGGVPFAERRAVPLSVRSGSPVQRYGSSVTGQPLDHVRANVEVWEARGEDQRELARRQWSADTPRWGIFGVPEEVAQILPPGLDGARVVELGCGTAYVSAWLARRGAHPVGVDPTPGQLRIARHCQDEHALRFPLLRGAGERVPLRDGSFDLVISEYGAAIWADPYDWVPEAARLLRPGGDLVFLGNSTLLALCVPDQEGAPATDRLLRPQFGMHRFTVPDDPSVEFHLGHGDWIRLLRANDFDVVALVELAPPPGVASEYAFVTAEWARRWPSEEVWCARRRRGRPTSSPRPVGQAGKARRETPQMADPRQTVVFRWLAAGDAGDVDAFDDLLHPDAVVHAPLGLSTTSVEEEKEVWRRALAAIPDLRHDVQEVVADGEVEMARVVVSGTMTASFGGVEGTGRGFRIDQAVVTNLRDGKVVEAWEIADIAALQAQVREP